LVELSTSFITKVTVQAPALDNPMLPRFTTPFFAKVNNAIGAWLILWIFLPLMYAHNAFGADMSLGSNVPDKDQTEPSNFPSKAPLPAPPILTRMERVLLPTTLYFRGNTAILTHFLIWYRKDTWGKEFGEKNAKDEMIDSKVSGWFCVGLLGIAGNALCLPLATEREREAKTRFYCWNGKDTTRISKNWGDLVKM
ncbi:hypothetical protein HDV05_004272, partial [Chytridiales sp. JEL 0842]